MADDSGSLSQDEIDALLNMGDDSGGGGDGGLGDLLGGGGGGDAGGGADDLNLDSLLGGGDSGGGGGGGATLDQDALNALAGAVGGPAPGAARPAAASGGGGRSRGSDKAENVDLLMDVTLRFSVELGRTQMYIKDVLNLGEGSIVELDKNVGDEVDILINDRLFGRGRLIVLDEFFGVQITHIIDPLTQFRSLS